MKNIKNYLNRLFIDGLSGMALGLFATLIIGTIIKQIGSYIPGAVGYYLILIGQCASLLTGAGIGIGVAVKLNEKAPLLVISAAAAGLVGAYASKIIAGSFFADNTFTFSAPGEPLGAFIAAYTAIEVGRLVSGKTPVDIIVTPFVTIISGSAIGLLLGPPISGFMAFLGNLVNINVDEHHIIGSIIVSVLMGIFLTLPISSAAIGISMGLSGLAAGAATIGLLREYDRLCRDQLPREPLRRRGCPRGSARVCSRCRTSLKSPSSGFRRSSQARSSRPFPPRWE